MSRLSASGNSSSSANAQSSALHLSADKLLAESSRPTHLELHREKFQERALRDVTINSADSAMMLDPNNPLLVKEEMEAQKDFFRRLKFTYLEQEAKRNFLFAISGDEPPSVSQGENEELETSNAQKKATLKATKDEIDGMREKAVVLAKANAEQKAELSKRTEKISTLQKQVQDMELELARIKATYPPEGRLTITQANQVLDEQILEIERLTESIETTNQRTESLKDEVARTMKEVGRLGRDREREEARAKEVREGREAGDTRVDELCAWYTSSINFYRSLLGIRSVTAISDSELHLLYNVSNDSDPGVTLALTFEPASKRLENAWLIGSEANVDEAINAAILNNDVPGLVADVLNRLRPLTK